MTRGWCALYCDGRGVHGVGRHPAALTDIRYRLYECLSDGGSLGIGNLIRLSLVGGLDLVEALDRVCLFIVVNYCVVSGAHQDKVGVGVALHVGLAGVIAGTPGPGPLY